MFENPRRGRQARNFTTNVSKILDLKSSSEQIFFRKLSLGAPVIFLLFCLSLVLLPPPLSLVYCGILYVVTFLHNERTFCEFYTTLIYILLLTGICKECMPLVL